MGRLAERSQGVPQIRRLKEELVGDFPVPIVTSCVSSNRFPKMPLRPFNKFLIANASLRGYLFPDIKWAFRLGCKI